MMRQPTRVLLLVLLLARIIPGIDSFLLPQPFIRSNLIRPQEGILFPINHIPTSKSTLIRHTAWKSNHEEDAVSPPRRRRRSRLRTTVLSVFFGLFLWTGRRQAAEARYSYEIQDNPTHSIRPGMTQSQANVLKEGGELDAEELKASSVFSADPSSTGTSTARPKTSSSSTLVDYGDDEDDEDFLDDEDVVKSGVVSQSDQAMAQRLQARTSDKFASYQQTKSKSLTIKVGLAFFVPTYGFLIVREYVRRRREENYVKKGLEILEAQKAEYFNVTATTDDSDVQDELKGLKKNQTATDEDDDDEDDDDEEDDDEEDEPRPPSRPRRPRGGGDDDGGSSGGGGGGGGDAPPSAEDLERLNNMFKKS